MTAAIAITIPIDPATLPNAAPTRVIFSVGSPGDIRLTLPAAMINARKALSRRPMIRPMIRPTPVASTKIGYQSIVCSIKSVTTGDRDECGVTAMRTVACGGDSNRCV